MTNNSTHTVEETVIPIQADRDAAAGLIDALSEGGSLHADRLRSGQYDRCDEIQAFARHRLASHAGEDVERVMRDASAWFRECSSWLLMHDLDMQCPMQADPLDIADALDAALTKMGKNNSTQHKEQDNG